MFQINALATVGTGLRAANIAISENNGPNKGLGCVERGVAIPMEIETLQQRILIADDQQDILDALRLMLKGHGYTTRGVTSSSDLLEALAKDEFDVLLMDLNYARNSTSGQEGLDLLGYCRRTRTCHRWW